MYPTLRRLKSAVEVPELRGRSRNLCDPMIDGGAQENFYVATS